MAGHTIQAWTSLLVCVAFSIGLRAAPVALADDARATVLDDMPP
jgi:hypothetical protein